MKTDLIGKIFGKYKVLDYAYTKDHKSYWKCEDKQGNILNIARENLKPIYGRKFVEDEIVGTKIWKLSVLYENEGKFVSTFHCKCDCGQECNVSGWKLRNGFIHSCGDCDHSGEEYNEIKILEKVGSRRFKCKCPYCGKLFISDYGSIKLGRTRSCGCLDVKPMDLTGIRFGKLTVVEKTKKKYNDINIWKCKCDCGTECNVIETNLLYGYATSCGCSLNISKHDNEVIEYISTIIDDEPVIVNENFYYEKYNVEISYNDCEYMASYGSSCADRAENYCNSKFLRAKEEGIHLINIFDTDWRNNREGIKYYLRRIFLPKKKININDCTIERLSKHDSKPFTYKYGLHHINKVSKFNYGVLYNGELLAIMIFDWRRNHNVDKSIYTIMDYVIKDGYEIEGMYKKVLEVFVKEHRVTSFEVFSDNDYDDGSIWEELGFEYVTSEIPKSFWELHGEAHNGILCRPFYLKNKYPQLYEQAEGSIEDYIMSHLGARKVFRSGTTKWIKRY